MLHLLKHHIIQCIVSAMHVFRRGSRNRWFILEWPWAGVLASDSTFRGRYSRLTSSMAPVVRSASGRRGPFRDSREFSSSSSSISFRSYWWLSSTVACFVPCRARQVARHLELLFSDRHSFLDVKAVADPGFIAGGRRRGGGVVAEFSQAHKPSILSFSKKNPGSLACGWCIVPRPPPPTGSAIGLTGIISVHGNSPEILFWNWWRHSHYTGCGTRVVPCWSLSEISGSCGRCIWLRKRKSSSIANTASQNCNRVIWQRDVMVYGLGSGHGYKRACLDYRFLVSI